MDKKYFWLIITKNMKLYEIYEIELQENKVEYRM